MSIQALKIWKMLFSGLLILVLFFLFLPSDLFTHSTPERQAVSKVLACTSNIEDLQNYQHECDNLINNSTFKNNQINFTIKDFPIILTYILDNNGKIIQCKGNPKKYFPTDCQ